MKKIAYSITTIAVTSILLLQNAVPAFAANIMGEQKMVNEVTHLENQASRSANKQANELQAIIKRADTLIGTRLNSLNKLLSRVQNDSRLSANEKSSLTSDIQNDITGLTNLKTKIDADTDATTARADAKTIITNYYVYAIFEPKVRLLITLNNLQTVTANMQALVPQLQNLINTFKAQGKDVTQLQSLLDDVSSQLQTINTTLTSDITTVEGISTTTQGASTTFSKVRQDIAQIVKTDFAKIRSDFVQMRPLFKQLINPTPSVASGSATETPASPSASE